MAMFANSPTPGIISGVLAGVRAGQATWATVPVRQRLAVVRRMRRLLADRADTLAATVARPAAETITAEILPLIEACRFLEHNGDRLLAPRRVRSYRPLWLRSVELSTRREPFGIVLIVGPANYPIFIPGVQLVQALVAGNGVLMKPGSAGGDAASFVMRCAQEAGIPGDAMALLDESPEAATEAIRCGVDKVLITGSNATGKAVLATLAPHVTPAVAELSGWDPVFVLADADLQLAASAIRFGVRLNRGNTCIRPRIVYGAAETLSRLRTMVEPAANQLEFVRVDSEEEALRRSDESEYALGATIFGSAARAKAFARHVRAGVVVINDMIVPTAHPAVAFGGRGASGFGLTRGAEGLLELTTLKTIAVQKSRWHPHLVDGQPGDARMFTAFVRTLHGTGMKHRMRALIELLHAGRNRRKEL